MNWNDLCGINTVAGRPIDMPTLVGPGVDHNRRNKTGMPDGTTLTAMMRAADDLRLCEAPKTRRGGVSDGISFHIAWHVPPPGVSQTIIKEFVGHKASSGVCYENTLFSDTLVGRINTVVGNIIVRQSVAPCTRCRAGYRQLAQNGSRTIVVSSDDGYDGVPDNTIFLFAPTGLVFYRR